MLRKQQNGWLKTDEQKKKDIFEYSGTSNGAKDYEALGNEILKREGLK